MKYILCCFIENSILTISAFFSIFINKHMRCCIMCIKFEMPSYIENKNDRNDEFWMNNPIQMYLNSFDVISYSKRGRFGVKKE